MHKLNYQSPELLLVLGEQQDIVRTSGEGKENEVDAGNQDYQDWWN